MISLMVSEVKSTKWSWLLMRELLNIPIGCAPSPVVSISCHSISPLSLASGTEVVLCYLSPSIV